MTIFFKTVLTIGVFLTLTLMAIIVLYTSQLRLRMQSFNSENVKLLDGMHEGLLILNKIDHTVAFCNRPSQKLLRGTMLHHDETEEPTLEVDSLSKLDEQARLMKPSVFYPIKVKIKE